MARSQFTTNPSPLEYQPLVNRILFSVDKSKCSKVIDGWFSNCEKPRSATVSSPETFRDLDSIGVTIKVRFECKTLQNTPQIIFALGKHRTVLLESSTSSQDLNFEIDPSLNYKAQIIESWNPEELIHQDCIISIEEIVFHS